MLRRASTDAERIVWNALRAHRMNGASFRRQVPIGPYVTDFVCHAANLVIEIDGGQHFELAHMKRDESREAFLTSKGYRVLRFNNRDAMTNRLGVFEIISAAFSAAPSPPLPRKRGRERASARGAP
jgi:very-short-patch-repair endonuclease